MDVRRDEGYEALRAANGADALQLLSSRAAPSLVLTDLMMPLMTAGSWSLGCERTRSTPAYPSSSPPRSSIARRLNPITS
jgi:CheY-like chemotaxis protein